MKTFRPLRIVTACACLGFAAPAVAADQLAPPPLKAEPGFTVQLIVPPGKVYDPLFLAKHGNEVWFNDDGDTDEDKKTGGRIWAVNDKGKLSVVADTAKFVPITGWDFAPASWGKDADKIVALSLPRTGKEGAYEANVIQVLDPKNKFAATRLCTLPQAGTATAMARPVAGGGRDTNGTPSLGADARFGPDGSAFAGKFFSLTLYNNTIYQTTSDGACKPFVVLDGKHMSRANQVAFTPDHKTMLVVVVIDANTAGEHGAVIRVTPEGKIEDSYINTGADFSPWGISVAPEGFGAYGGQIFLAGVNYEGTPGTPGRKRIDNGIVRVTADGMMHPVARGWYFVYNINFVDSQRLFASDIHGDYVVGGVEVPDGNVTVIRAVK